MPDGKLTVLWVETVDAASSLLQAMYLMVQGLTKLALALFRWMEMLVREISPLFYFLSFKTRIIVGALLIFVLLIHKSMIIPRMRHGVSRIVHRIHVVLTEIAPLVFVLTCVYLPLRHNLLTPIFDVVFYGALDGVAFLGSIYALLEVQRTNAMYSDKPLQAHKIGDGVVVLLDGEYLQIDEQSYGDRVIIDRRPHVSGNSLKEAKWLDYWVLTMVVEMVIRIPTLFAMKSIGPLQGGGAVIPGGGVTDRVVLTSAVCIIREILFIELFSVVLGNRVRILGRIRKQLEKWVSQLTGFLTGFEIRPHANAGPTRMITNSISFMESMLPRNISFAVTLIRSAPHILLIALPSFFLRPILLFVAVGLPLQSAVSALQMGHVYKVGFWTRYYLLMYVWRIAWTRIQTSVLFGLAPFQYHVEYIIVVAAQLMSDSTISSKASDILQEVSKSATPKLEDMSE